MSENLSIIAIGGGGPATGSRPFIEAGLDLTGKPKPRLLHIPTARPTEQAYNDSVEPVRRLYGDELGLPFDVLHPFGSVPAAHIIDEKLAAADIVYISGGNTRQLRTIWHEHGIDQKIRTAAAAGTVITGISAGMLAPFEAGHSDAESYEKPEGEPWEYIAVDGLLGIVRAVGCPHYDTHHPQTEQPRAENFQSMMREQFSGRTGVAADNQAALRIVGGSFDVMTVND